MATSKEYRQFILEQLSCLEGIDCRAMMGEYVLYCHGKVFGGIYDNRFLVKDVSEARTRMPHASLEVPYPGGKAMLLVEEVDNPLFLKELVEAMWAELPALTGRGKKA